MALSPHSLLINIFVPSFIGLIAKTVNDTVPPKTVTILVACYATLHPAMLVHWLVLFLVNWLVSQLVPFFIFLAFLSFLSLLLLPKCFSDLFLHCSCPPARDQGSRVSGLVQVLINCENKISSYFFHLGLTILVSCSCTGVKCAFSHFFESIITDQPTNGLTNGQSLLQNCVLATEKKKKK